ncbi:MAG: ABC transporter permease [Alphaproteobacteria bacterium]
MLKKNYLRIACGTIYQFALLGFSRHHWWVWTDSINAILLIGVFSIIGTNFSSVYQTDQIYVIGMGLWVMVLLNRAYFGTAWTLMFHKLEHVLENLVMSPLPAWGWLGMIIIEYVQNAIIAAMPFIILLLLFGMPIPSLSGFLLSVALLCLAMVFFTAFGFLMMLGAQKWNDLSKWDNTLIMPLFMLSGSFFDATALPEKYRFLMEWNPVYQLQYGIRQLWFLDHNPIAYNFLIWGGMTTFIIIISLIAISRGYGLKQ